MADVTERIKTGFHSLPSELQYRIFEYIYPPWHLEYTQVHDNFPSQGPKILKAIADDVVADMDSIPLFARLPSIAPLLTCRTFHEAGRQIFELGCTGHVHVISGSYWKEVHWTYACVMAKATKLTIDIHHLSSLHLCKILARMTSLETVIITMKDFLTTNILHDPHFNSSNEDGMPEQCHQLALEGSELAVFLPVDIDLSDMGLQSSWDRAIEEPFRPAYAVFDAFRLRIDQFLHEIIPRTSIEMICRVIINPSVLPRYADEGIIVFLVMDFYRVYLESPVHDDSERYVLIRKRLALIEQDNLPCS